MSIKRATKLTKFLAFAGLSLLLSGLFWQLSKKEQYNYSSLLDFETGSASADIGTGTGTGTGDSGSADGNDSGGGDGDF